MARISYNATTNSQGVANANITGQGLGKLKFIGKVDDIWSNTIEIDDYLFYDDGVSGNQTDYVLQTDRLTKEVTSDGTVLTVISTSQNYGHCFIKSSNPVFSYPLKVEFDIVDSSGSENFNIYNTNGESRCPIARNGHYIVTINANGEISATCDGNNLTIYNLFTVSSLTRLSFFVNGLGDYLVFRNLEIYSYVDLKHYTPITLSSNKPMVDSMDSTILSAKLTNVVGGAVTNTNVDFLENDDLYGADVSDNNGVANLELSNDAIGKRIFKAVSGTVESEELVMWDTLFNDMGTIEHHNDEIWNDTTYLTRGTEYSTFFNENGIVTPYFEVSGDICIEFDIMTDMSASAGLISIRYNTTTLGQVTLANMGLTNDTFHHIIIKIKNNACTITNTTNSTVVNRTVNNYNRFYLRSASNYHTYFKNLVIYLND